MRTSLAGAQAPPEQQDGLAPERLPLGALAGLVQAESGQFLRHQPSDDRFCLELFRRAARGDQGAWACLYQQYRPLVLAWLAQQRGAAPLLVQDGPDPLVNATFARFARAMTPAKMESFTRLSAVLNYLKRCVRSAVVDEVRSRRTFLAEEPLDVSAHDREAGGDPAEVVAASLAAQGLWQIIEGVLPGEDERVVLYLFYVLGLKPGEIASSQRRLFQSPADVYRVKRSVQDRLRRNKRLHILAGA